MDTQEYLRAVDALEVTMSTQRMAKELVSSLTQMRVDVLNERFQAGDNRALLKFPVAAWLDFIDDSTGFATRRPQVYHFNRELGFSRLEAMKHTSPSTGLATAALALSLEAHAL